MERDPFFPNNVILEYDRSSIERNLPYMHGEDAYRVQLNCFYDKKVLVEVKSGNSKGINCYQTMMHIDQENILKVIMKISSDTEIGYTGFVLENFDSTFHHYIINCFKCPEENEDKELAAKKKEEKLNSLLPIIKDFLTGLNFVGHEKKQLGKISDTTFLVGNLRGKICHLYESSNQSIDARPVIDTFQSYLRPSWNEIPEKIKLFFRSLQAYKRDLEIINPQLACQHPLFLTDEEELKDYIITKYARIEDGWLDIIIVHEPGNPNTRGFSRTRLAFQVIDKAIGTLNWTVKANQLAKDGREGVKKILEYDGREYYRDTPLSFFTFSRNYLCHDEIDLNVKLRINTLEEIWPSFWSYIHWGLVVSKILK